MEKYDAIRNPNGGKLLLRSFGEFIVESGGVIDCNGKGYTGGDRWYSGQSYLGKSALKAREANYGGSGCTKLYSALWCLSSGGGGYGTKGEDGVCHTYNNQKYEFEGLGGQTYGDKELKHLHLGSGGGGSKYCRGGDGGGALKIICHKFVNNGVIEVNGKKGGGATKNGGGGSGGSCLIIVYGKEFDNERGLISCVGAESIHQFGRGGSGGDGRICIKFLGNNENDFARKAALKLFNEDGTRIDEHIGKRRKFGNIEPKPYIITNYDT